MSFLGALTLLFIGLKLGGIITWSWWLVLLPLYGVAGVFIGMVLTGGVLVGIVHGIQAVFEVSKTRRINRFQ